MKPWFVLLPAVALTVACGTQLLESPDDPESRRVAEVVRAEERLTAAITQGRAGTVNLYLAKDFRCAVADHAWFTYDHVTAREIACTGYGHDRRNEARHANWAYQFQNGAPRVATIDDVAVKLNERGATVVSLQTYTNWLPFSGPEPRRSRVTDKWLLENGKWRLIRRFSEPLAANEVATLLPSR